MYDLPPYYYVRSTTNGVGQWLPVIRVSHAAGGFPSIFVRMQEPGDYRHPIHQTDIEYALVQRVDYAQVARAQESRLAQFIRPVYPPHLPHGVENRDTNRTTQGGERASKPQRPTVSTTAIPTIKRSASVAQIAYPNSILKKPSSPDATTATRPHHSPHRMNDPSDSTMPQISLVRSDSTSNSVSSTSTGSGYTSSSAHSSLFNVPRSALHHYTTPQKSFPARGMPEYRVAKSTLPPFPQAGIAHSMPIYHSSDSLVYDRSPRATSPTYQTVIGGSDPIEYRPEQVPVYSSFELYQSPNKSSPHNSHPPTSRPRVARRRSSSSSSGIPISGFGEGAYGSGLGMAGGIGAGMDYDGGSKSRGGKWWKLGR